MSEAAKRNGQPCAKCGMKDGAHNYRNPHPKACASWRTAADLREEREEASAAYDSGDWIHDPDMEARG